MAARNSYFPDLKVLFLKRTPGLGFMFEKDGRRILNFRKAWGSAFRRAKLAENFVFQGLY